jgi:excisionase family DNA binding protein
MSETPRPNVSLGLLTVEELAAELQISVRGVRRLIAVGEIPALRIGRSWYCRREALLARFRAAETRRHERKRHDQAEIDLVVRALAPHSTSGPR